MYKAWYICDITFKVVVLCIKPRYYNDFEYILHIIYTTPYTFALHNGPQSSGKNRIPSIRDPRFLPENGWLEDEFPFGMAQFQGRFDFGEGHWKRRTDG